jgi:hypothetical protein
MVGKVLTNMSDKFTLPSLCIISLTFWEENIVRVFEDRLPKKIFGLKREEVTSDWGKLHKEELHDLIFLTKQRYGDQMEEVAECGMLEVWDRREMG